MMPLRTILRFPHYLFTYYGKYWWYARIGLQEVYYLWYCLEGDC